MTFTFLPVQSVIALLATATLAYFLGRRLKERLSAILIAGLAIPTVIMLIAYYYVATAEPNDPPAGIFLMAALAIAALATPVTLIISWFAVRLAKR